jgi:hypothetical protein
MLTLAGPWPRWFAVAGTTPAAPTPVLRVLSSPDARSPYGLWGHLSLLPGAVLPELASATIGAPALGPDATGLACSPAETLERYADLLTRGDASAHRGEFGVDAYRSEVTAQLGADRQALAAKGLGQVVAVHTASAEAPFAMPTQDGGALVIGRIDQRYTATVAPGKGSVRLGADLAVLAGRATVAGRLERRSAEVVAFHVPPAGSRDTITLIAAGKADVGATGS